MTLPKATPRQITLVGELTDIIRELRDSGADLALLEKLTEKLNELIEEI